MIDPQQTWLVAVREMRERVRSRGFRAVLVIMLVVVVAAIVVPAMLDPSPVATDVGLTGAIPTGLPRALSDQGDIDVTVRVHRYDDVSIGEEAVREDDIDCSWSTGEPWSGEAMSTKKCVPWSPPPSNWSPCNSGLRPLASVPKNCSSSWPRRGRERRTRLGGGQRLRQRDGRRRDEHPVARGRGHLWEPGAHWRRRSEVPPSRRGAARKDASARSAHWRRKRRTRPVSPDP